MPFHIGLREIVLYLIGAVWFIGALNGYVILSRVFKNKRKNLNTPENTTEDSLADGAKK